jgi:hypothetical protein
VRGSRLEQSDPLTPVVLDCWVEKWREKVKRNKRAIAVDVVLIAFAAVVIEGAWQIASAGALGVAITADIGRLYTNAKWLRELRELRAFVSLDEKLVSQVWLSVTGNNRAHARKLLLERKRLRADFKREHPGMTEGWTA